MRAGPLALAVALVLSGLAAPTADAGVFAVADCARAKDGKLDPIVSFGLISAHMHTFRGNTSISHRSTLASLRRGSTSCRRNVDRHLPGSGDLSAYWVPSLLERDPATGRDKPVPLFRTATYYYGAHRDPSRIRPFPPGLKMRVGDPHATPAEAAAAARAGGRVVWSCGGAGRLSVPNTPSYCVDTDLHDGRTPRLRLNLRFPSCWDGARPSDAATEPDRTTYDDSAHMAHKVAVNGNNASPWTCPSTHPIPVPELHMIWIWQTRGGAGVRLATHNQYGGHGDFFNAWHPGVLSKLVRNCLRANVNCDLRDTARTRRGVGRLPVSAP